MKTEIQNLLGSYAEQNSQIGVANKIFLDPCNRIVDSLAGWLANGFDPEDEYVDLVEVEYDEEEDDFMEVVR